MTSEPVDWTEHGPHSPRFDDVYFSRTDGLAESRAVFLEGCGLPQAWADRHRFTVAELGFGTGLNILAVLDLWRRTRPPGARLQLFSVEAYPLARADAARALEAWPELADLAAPLVAAWPDGRRGLHRIDFPALGATLDLAVADVAEALAGWDGAADAWFLDGFAPARNPQMWSEDILALVAARSAPGARAATFTVAGAVGPGRAAAGVQVDKRPGFGRKRERLEARLAQAAAPAAQPTPQFTPRVAIVGAGIAGAALTRAFHALDLACTVYETASAGAGASGNPVALVTPRLDAGLGPIAVLYAQAFARATVLYRSETPHSLIAEGAVQLEVAPRDAARFDTLAAWDGFAPGALQRLDLAAAAAALDEAAGPGGLFIRDALVVEPQALLSAWLAGATLIRAAVARLSRDGGVWRLVGAGGETLGEAEIVCLAAGASLMALHPSPLRPVRGQVSWMEGASFTGAAGSWSGYAAPMRGGVLFGATHDRDDAGVEVRAQDHDRNLFAVAQGRPRLAARLDPARLAGRASLRVAAQDYLPLAGAVAGEPGLFVLSGLGGRGFCLAPLLAEQVAAMAVGAAKPLPLGLAALVDPERFAGRA